MYENSFQCLSKAEEEYFNESFLEKIGQRDLIFFGEFKEVVFGLPKYAKNISFTNELLEKIKKKIKERQVGISENDLYLSIIILITLQ